MTPRTSGFHVLTTSPWLQTATDRKTSLFDVILSLHTCVQVSHDYHPSGTDGDRRRAVRAHSPFFLQCGPRSPTRVQVFVRMLWLCACQATDRDFERVSGNEEGECLDICLSDNRP